MRNDHIPFVMLQTEVSDENKKNKQNKQSKRDKRCDELVEMVNRGIDIYQYSAVTDEAARLVSQRLKIKEALKNDLELSEIKELVATLKSIEPRISELTWRYENSRRLADPELIAELIELAFDDQKDDIKRMLHQYQTCSFYVLHTADNLIDVAEEMLPLLESCVLALLKKLNKKSALLDQVLLLKKALEEERARIAAGMALRIEAAFYYHDLAQDDALVYVYNRLIEAGPLKDDVPFRTPERSLDTPIFSRFCMYIQDHGSAETKTRLHAVMTVNPADHSEVFKTGVRQFEKKRYKIPSQLNEYVPQKKPSFGWGSRMRYEFFQKHSGTVVLLESYGRWEERHHPYSNVSHLYRIREEIRRHREEVKNAQGFIRGIRGLFLGKSKRFLVEWQSVLVEEEHRSWVRHYDALKKQTEDYLRYPNESVNTKDDILSHLSLFMAELEKFGPPFTQVFLEPLRKLKGQLNKKISETKSLIETLDSQIQLSEALLEDDPISSDVKGDTLSLSSSDIDAMQMEAELLDESDDLGETDEISGSSDKVSSMSEAKKARVSAWAQGLFPEPKLGSSQESNQSSSLLVNKH